MTGIGRTPVREAIQRLAREHLVVVLPQRGIFISEINPTKQVRLLETRREVERLICRSAAQRASEHERLGFRQLAAAFKDSSANGDDEAFMRADRDFNELLLTSARNEFAEGAMQLLNGLSRRFWFAFHTRADDLHEMAELHEAVAFAIGAGEVDQAGDANDRLIDHLESLVRSMIDR